MKNTDLKIRTKKFAKRCLKLAGSMPKNFVCEYIAKQLIRSSQSTAANYRASCLAQSKKEFTSKISIVLEEVDESAYWIEIIEEEKMIPIERLVDIKKESIELTRIFAKSRITARKKPPSEVAT